jgi:hypothetical protein
MSEVAMPNPQRDASPALTKLAPMSYPSPSILQPTAVLNPMRHSLPRHTPLNVSIYREPIATFPLFQQVMPDIAQYHLSKSNPYTPEASPRVSPDMTGDSIKRRQQDMYRPGYEHPIPVDSPFNARHMNPPSHPLFP